MTKNLPDGMIESPFFENRELGLCIEETDLAIAINNRFPATEHGHLLIIPQRVVTTPFEMTDEELTDIFELAQKSKPALDEVYSPDGYSIGWNIGITGAQKVGHVHLHIMGRKDGDVPDPAGGIARMFENDNPEQLTEFIAANKGKDLPQDTNIFEPESPASADYTIIVGESRSQSFFDTPVSELVASVRAAQEKLESLGIATDGSDNSKGANIGWNEGEAAGQLFTSSAMHLVPRTAGDIEKPIGGICAIIPATGDYYKNYSTSDEGSIRLATKKTILIKQIWNNGLTTNKGSIIMTHTPHIIKNMETYDRDAGKFSGQYDGVETFDVLGGLEERLPELKLLDVGCGNGRDAETFAKRGFKVDAIDGSEGMLRAAAAGHAHENITYSQDMLPDLANIREKGDKYDAIVLSAVIFHLDKEERAQLVENLVEVAAPGAITMLTLRHGPTPEDRPMFEVSADELRHLAAFNMVGFEHMQATSEDKLGRGDVWWDNVYLNAPSDHLDALEVLKTEVVQGKLSATYKPAFLISLAEALRENGSDVTHVDAANVEIPLEAIAKPWQRIYETAIDLEVPQMAGKAPLTAPLPHLSRESMDVERGIAQVLSRGPLRHIKDPESGQQIFRLSANEDGQRTIRMPREFKEAIESYDPLVNAGAVEAIQRHLTKMRDAQSPEAIERFIRDSGIQASASR